MRILVIDDEKDLVKALKQLLTAEKYMVDTAYDGETGLDMARGSIYDVLIVDVMLPRLTGFELVHLLREEGNVTPILLLSARDGVDDRVQGLDSGADDYLIKPFSIKELLARIRALGRRNADIVGVQTITVGDYSLDLMNRILIFQGEKVTLTHKELQLIELFMRNPGQVLTKDVIFDRIWGYESDADSNVVEAYIHFLRKKLSVFVNQKTKKDQGIGIQTVRGTGYVFKGV